MPRGEKNKLNHHQKEEIFFHKGKTSAYVLARKYGVSHTTIYNIWKQQSPKTCREALRKIRTQIERVRGVEMNQTIYEMWISISATLDEAMEEQP